MPVGVSAIVYPDQLRPEHELVPEDCYYLVRLHEAQAYYEPGLFARLGPLAFSSSVSGTLLGDQTVQSLHQVSTFRKDTPCYLGLGINLTDWLPARRTDSLRITLKYTLLQESPLANLVQTLEKSDLVAKVSLLKPDWAVAMKVSAIAGKFLGAIIKEGTAHEPFARAST